MEPRSFGVVRTLAGVLAATLIVLARAPIVAAITEAEQTFLTMYFTEAELKVVSATRSLQSIARVAENIEVVTARDIELMNAHTLAQVLDTVAGVQSTFATTVGARAMADIQGSGGDRVTVLMNGVPLNFVSENIAEVGFVPVQDIEKIEIVKGPASSTWGSALGGVVNVITRRPGDRPFEGTASASYGAENTADCRAAVSGRLGRLGYYLSGTGLRTDGLTEGYDVDAGHLGARLEYAFGRGTTAALNLFYGDASRGDGILPAYDMSFGIDSKRLVTDLSVGTAVGEAGRLELSAWATRFREEFRVEALSDGAGLASSTGTDTRRGAGAKYAWSRGGQDVVVGAEYSTGEMENNELPGQEPSLTHRAVYANDAIGLGPLTITPGLRYDDPSNADAFWSPSLGATYSLSKDVLARATVARGFSVPSLAATSITSAGALYQANPDLSVEKVWSYQVGVESNVADLFWVKVSAFRHDVEDAMEMVWVSPDWWTFQNIGEQRRQGVEVAFRTRPYFNLALTGDAFFMKTEDLDTGETVADVPRRIFDLSLKYDDQRSLRALLRGRYWHADEPAEYNGDLGDFIWDLSVMKKIALGSRASLEAFLAAHNLLDGSQYRSDGAQNPGRWAEGGVRVAF